MSNDDFKDKVDDVVEKAKEFAEVAVKKAGEIAVVIGEKTEQAYEKAKKMLESEKIQASIVKKQRELGKAYYANVKGEELNSLDVIVAELDTLNAALVDLKKKEAETDGQNDINMDIDE